MPGVPEIPDFFKTNSAPAWQVAKLAQQQNKTIVNPQGQAIINEGLIPGSSPAAWGWQAVNPATGQPMLFIGEDGTGAAYIAFYDGNGNVTTKIDSQGVHILNVVGQEEARLGQLSSSPAIYGLGVAPATGSAPGTLQQVGGALSIVNTSGLSSITTSQAVPSTSITAEIGPSESALITVGAQITMSSGVGSTCHVIVRLDGVNNGWGGVWGFGLASGSHPETSGSYTAIMGPVTGITITPGTHTFDCYAVLAGGATCTISDVTLNVQPL